VPDSVELMLADLDAKYRKLPASDAFIRLYQDDAHFGHIFASIHERLNMHFMEINGRIKTTKHYWAQSSRELLNLIDEVDETLHILERANFEVKFSAGYRDTINRARPWLSMSGGSTIPEDFDLIQVIKWEPVFVRPDTQVKLRKASASAPLTLVGEGSYATVYSFVDPDYGIKFAVKRAKKTLDDRELQRFKAEFEYLSELNFPYIIDVYRYNTERNEYTMEYCDETLRSYVKRRNRDLRFGSRKRIALQFLYGINYLHFSKLLHRDISLQNVLLKVFEGGAVLVKLSDFGLAKDTTSHFTRTNSQVRGTITDPSLDNFRDYSTVNEIYALGWVLAFIFTGRESLPTGTDPVVQIVHKCTDRDPGKRYQQVIDLIADVERLVATPSEASA